MVSILDVLTIIYIFMCKVVNISTRPELSITERYALLLLRIWLFIEDRPEKSFHIHVETRANGTGMYLPPVMELSVWSKSWGDAWPFCLLSQGMTP